MGFPKKIYVLEERDGKDTYLVAFKEIAEIPEDQDGRPIGIYELKGSGKLFATKEIGNLKWEKK